MITSPSSPTSSSSFVAVAGQPPTAPELPGSSKNTGIDTHKTIGFDNPEIHGAAAKPLDLYAINSSDDESEVNDGILTLETGDRSWVDMNENVKAVSLDRCLCLVHVPDKGKTYLAWHIAGMDLCNLLNPEIRNMASRISPIEVQASDSSAKFWKESVQKNPGTTYLCGPNADDLVRDFFKVDPENVTRTEKGPVSVTFDIATRRFIQSADSPRCQHGCRIS